MSDWEDDFGGSDYSKSNAKNRKIKRPKPPAKPPKKPASRQKSGGFIDDDYVLEDEDDYDSDSDSGDD